MKRIGMFAAVALAGALAVGVLAGCTSGQPSSSSSSPSASSTSSQDAALAELKEKVANPVEYKSVTITEETVSEAIAGEATDKSADAVSASSKSASAESASSEAAEASDETAADKLEVTEEEAAGADVLTSKSVYKFDESDAAVKTYTEQTFADYTVKYYSVGQDAVLVTDGPVYSGTTEQFEGAWFGGSKAYLESTIGDLEKIVECATSVEKIESEATDDLVAYAIELDLEKYMDSDEILSLMKENTPVEKATVTISFNKDGYIEAVDKVVVYGGTNKIQSEWHLLFSDYDSTVIDEMPAATADFETMQTDVQTKLDEFAQKFKKLAEDVVDTTADTIKQVK